MAQARPVPTLGHSSGRRAGCLEIDRRRGHVRAPAGPRGAGPAPALTLRFPGP